APAQCRWEYDVGYFDRAGEPGARVEDDPGLERPHGDRPPRAHGDPRHRSRFAVDAGRDVHRRHRYPGIVQDGDRLGESPLRLAVEPRPEDRVHADVSSAQLSLEPLLRKPAPAAP